MQKGYSTQLRLDSLSIDQAPLNLECRSRIVPILRADSFVVQTNIHYPTESLLIRDGLRKIIEMCPERMTSSDRTRCRHSSLAPNES